MGAFPRSAVVPDRGGNVEFAVEALSVEPQYVVSSDGRRWRADAGFYPDIMLAARYAIRPCEIGGGGSWDRLYAEGRCGVWQAHRGAPLDVAVSVAGGIQLQDATPWGRVGIDVSKSFGWVTPIVDVYLTRGDEHHAVNITPSPGEEVDSPYTAETLARYETRLVVPFGFALRLARDHSGEVRLVLGASPYWILDHNDCQGPGCAPVYHVDHGAMLSIGLEWTAR